MKKTIKMRELECAHCAAKMETAIRKLEGVVSADINFMLQKLTIEAEDERFDAILRDAAKICKRIEPDCELVI